MLDLIGGSQVMTKSLSYQDRFEEKALLAKITNKFGFLVKN